MTLTEDGGGELRALSLLIIGKHRPIARQSVQPDE